VADAEVVALLGDLNAAIERSDLEPLRRGLEDAFDHVVIPAGDERRQSLEE
jgi:hypothetical protein